MDTRERWQSKERSSSMGTMPQRKMLPPVPQLQRQEHPPFDLSVPFQIVHTYFGPDPRNTDLPFPSVYWQKEKEKLRKTFENESGSESDQASADSSSTTEATVKDKKDGEQRDQPATGTDIREVPAVNRRRLRPLPMNPAIQGTHKASSLPSLSQYQPPVISPHRRDESRPNADDALLSSQYQPPVISPHRRDESRLNMDDIFSQATANTVAKKELFGGPFPSSSPQSPSLPVPRRKSISQREPSPHASRRDTPTPQPQRPDTAPLPRPLTAPAGGPRLDPGPIMGGSRATDAYSADRTSGTADRKPTPNSTTADCLLFEGNPFALNQLHAPLVPLQASAASGPVLSPSPPPAHHRTSSPSPALTGPSSQLPLLPNRPAPPVPMTSPLPPAHASSSPLRSGQPPQTLVRPYQGPSPPLHHGQSPQPHSQPQANWAHKTFPPPKNQHQQPQPQQQYIHQQNQQAWSNSSHHQHHHQQQHQPLPSSQHRQYQMRHSSGGGGGGGPVNTNYNAHGNMNSSSNSNNIKDPIL